MRITFDSTLDDGPTPGAVETVQRRGLLFRTGHYPDKDFALSVDEADAAIAAFTPVNADYEHIPGPLDGHLGSLRAVWREGDALYGEATIPAWLDPLLAESGRKLSLAWDRATKTITGWGWVRTPRVTDAALMSAYATFAGARHNTTDQRALNAAHDHIVAAGANNCPAATPKEARMSLWDQFKAALEGTPAATFTEEGETQRLKVTDLQPMVLVPDPRVAELEAQVAAQAAQFAAQAATYRQEQATAFADSLVLAQHILPAARPAVLALFAQALADDAATPAVVAFSDATGARTASRADTLRAVFGALPAPDRTAEHLPAGSTVLPPAGAPAAPTAAEKQTRKTALLRMTPLGQAALQHHHGKDA